MNMTHRRRRQPNQPRWAELSAMVKSIKSQGEPSIFRWWRGAREDPFWHAAMTSKPPANYTPKLIVALKDALEIAHQLGCIQHAVLCYQEIVHVATEPWDMAWGCGYRNFLMSCTALINQEFQPPYSPLLTDPSPPSVRSLQLLIEQAWKDGYDPRGAARFKKLVGTKKWIGTAELYVAFVSRGIPVELVDFPRTPKGVQPLLNWIVDYFGAPCSGDAQGNPQPVVSTDKMPLILQYQGHSRTVVGYQVERSGQIIILVFDPSRYPPRSLRNADSNSRGDKLTDSFRKALAVQSHRMQNFIRRASEKWHHEGSVMSAAETERSSAGETSTSNPHINPDEDGSRNRLVDEGVKHDALHILQHFSLSTAKLRHRKTYQILWFPLEPPLSAPERWERRIVTSDRVT